MITNTHTPHLVDKSPLAKLLKQNSNALEKYNSPEIEIMQIEAEKSNNVLGFRATGCGFGGNTITLIKESAIHTYVEQMSEIYEFETDVQNSFFTAQIGNDIFKLYDIESY